MKSPVEDELLAVVKEWDQAMEENNVEAIGRYMAEDWTITGSDGSVSDKATFLGLISSGALTHDVMETENPRIRVYGDAAVITARGTSGGRYQGIAFREVEQTSNVFVRQSGRWRCVLTHLSKLG